ncbi:hypothetical protein KFE25_002070 [Diacronema lutheri]|uniref:Uncharacterized protein n=1 Tax=Diacronema lutheri TaxID=2081491 RepID=A0A8J6CB88_DIALT|nr:hypothetical protein KFE25_002070 [Diacronema lutheri]
MVAALAVAPLLAALASSARGPMDMRSLLQPQDLLALLEARGESCAGCSREQLVGKLRATDPIGRELASKGMLEIVVRYCAS